MSGGIECAFFGALSRDAELKTSRAGKQYLRLNVRVGENDGAQWVSVMAFDPAAITVVDKMIKGARIYCEGRVEINEWSGQDGAKRHGLSCLSWHCHLSAIGRNRPKRKPDADDDRPRGAGSGRAEFPNDPLPF
jgi:single-stranded DNA-binding protein